MKRGEIRTRLCADCEKAGAKAFIGDVSAHVLPVVCFNDKDALANQAILAQDFDFFGDVWRKLQSHATPPPKESVAVLTDEALDIAAENLNDTLTVMVSKIAIMARIGAASPAMVDDFADNIIGLLNVPRDGLDNAICAAIAGRVEILLNEALLAARKEAQTHWQGD